MVRMCFLTGVLTMIFILKSCIFSGCEKIALNQEDLSWYKSLPNEGDTLFFRGYDGTIDTFIVSNNVNEFSDCNRFEIGDYQYNMSRYTATLINSKRDRNINNRFYIFLTKKHQIDSSTSCNKLIQVFDLYTNELNSLDMFKHDTILIKSLKRHIPTIFIDKKSKNTNVESSSKTIKIQSFNWNKEYGLVRYMTEDSVVYEYWKKR